MIAKDLVVVAVPDPSWSWPTRRQTADAGARAARGMVWSAGRQTPATAQNAAACGAAENWHGRLAQDNATARNSRKRDRKSRY